MVPVLVEAIATPSLKHTTYNMFDECLGEHDTTAMEGPRCNHVRKHTEVLVLFLLEILANESEGYLVPFIYKVSPQTNCPPDLSW